MVRRTTDGALEQIADPFLQYLVGGKPDRVLDALRFEILVHFGVRESGVAAEVEARDLPA